MSSIDSIKVGNIYKIAADEENDITTSEKLLSGKLEGELDEADLNEALRLVKLSRRHDHILLKMYGII